MVSNWLRVIKLKIKMEIRIAPRKIEKNRSLRLEMIGCIWRYYHFTSFFVYETEAGLFAKMHQLPVEIEPARSYVTIMTPLEPTMLSVTLKAAGIVPSANKRFPLPKVIG